jgi:two-component system response regulator AtoC
MTTPALRSLVLVIDDEEAIRDVLHEALTDRGYDVVTADTAVGGLAAARERRPDVILLDLYMPGALTGDQAMKALSAFAPIIVITASTDEELGRRLLGEGAFDFVMKPFDLARVANLVAAAVTYGSGRA